MLAAIVAVVVLFVVNHKSDDSPAAGRSTPLPVIAGASAVTEPLTADGLNPVGGGGVASAPQLSDVPASAAQSASIAVDQASPSQSAASESAEASPIQLRITYNTSFDCAKAAREDEQAICSDPGLAAMDLEMAQVYAAAFRAASDPAALTEAQRDWLSVRAMCNSDVGCLRHAYGVRLGQYHGSLGSKPPTVLDDALSKP